MRFSPWNHTLQSPSPRSQQQDISHRLVLSIGGRLFETSTQTLSVDSNSMLAAWVLRHLPFENNVLWIDRDAGRFKHVLNYLRNGTIWLEDVVSLRGVQEEASFFGLTGLHDLCEERIQLIEAKEEAMHGKLKDDLREVFNGVLETRGMCPRNKCDVASSVVKGRRLGCENANEPVFQLDADF